MTKDQLGLEFKARDDGIERAAARNAHALEVARLYAEAIGRREGTCHIGQVRDAMLKDGVPLHPGNWMGSVFKVPTMWAPTRDMAHTSHKGGHARLVRVWRFKHAGC